MNERVCEKCGETEFYKCGQCVECKRVKNKVRSDKHKPVVWNPSMFWQLYAQAIWPAPK